jgi:parallel beta-helix repeat protein
MQRTRIGFLTLLAMIVIANSAWAVTINVPADQATIAAAVGVAGAGDVIQVAGSHSETVLSTINLNVPNLQIIAASGATANLGATAIMFLITGSGTTIDGLTMTSAIPYAAEFIQVGASNVTIQNCLIYGPPQALPMSGWVTNRGFTTQGGISNFVFTNNEMHSMRSGGYLTGDLVNRGTFSNNLIYNTKGGFLIEYSSWTFTGNSWGTIANANEWDIVIFPPTDPSLYPDAVALSDANNGGTVWDQRAPSLKTPVYVDAAAAPGGIGSPRLPYQTIQDGVNNVYSGGKVLVANGTYPEALNIYKSMSLIGASQAGVLIDASAIADYGIDAAGAYDFVFKNFTLDGPDAVVNFTYGMKISGLGSSAEIENVTVQNCNRTCIDLNRVSSGSITNCTAMNAVSGNGLALTDCNNITINGLTTANNPWGGCRIGSYQGTFTGVVVTGTNSFGELGLGGIGLFIEQGNVNPAGPPFPVTYSQTGTPDVLIQDADAAYALYGDDNEAPRYQRVIFFPMLAQAITAAGFPNYSHITTNKVIQKTSDGTFWVAPGMLIQAAINAASAGGEINVLAGTFVEDVTVNKAVTVRGAGIDISTISGAIGGDSYTVRMAAVGSILEGFTLTREGNNVADWNLALNTTAVAIQGTGGAIVRNNKMVGNRTGIDINDADDNQILNNVIDFNRTGMILRNSCLNNLVEENAITNNWTVGVLWLSVGNPNNYATDCKFFNNDISGNWYTQVENRDVISGDVRDFSGNWLGTNAPVTAAGDGSEPGYSSIIPVVYGGTSTPPGGAVTLRGAGLASIDYTPWLNAGTDTNVETDLGRGTIGFQGNYSNLWVDDLAIQPLGVVQEAVDMVSGSTINLLAGTYVGQVHASGFSDLNIIGAGAGVSILQAPNSAMTDFFNTGANNNYPVLFIDNSTADVSNLTIDGAGKGAFQYRFVGLGYWNSDGTVTNVDVDAVRNTPLNGTQHGVGVYISNDDAMAHDVNLTNMNITDFQKNGTVFFAAGTNVDCDNVNITGAGPIGSGMPAQNGFQYSSGASGSLLNCSVNDVVYLGPSATVGTSILAYDNGALSVTNTDVNNGQVGIYVIDGDLTVNGGTFTSTNAVTVVEKYGITAYSSGAALASVRAMPEVFVDGGTSRGGNGRLDDDETVAISNVTVTGDGSANGFGVSAYVDGGNLDFTVNNADVVYWDHAIDLTANGGTINTGSVTNSSMVGNFNTYDNTASHVWNSNCYSDYPSNAGYPGTYEVDGGAGIVDNNPNPNGCSDLNLVVSDALIGCNTGCTVDTLYITLDAAGIPNLQVVIDIPAGFASALPVNGIVTPGSNVDPNLLQAFAVSINLGTQVQVEMGFEAPGSTGNNALYVACIPIVNVSATSGSYAFTGNSSLWIDYLGGNHIDELLLGTISVEVDCTDPEITDFLTNETCSFGSAAQVVDAFSATLSDADADLESAWVTFAPGGGSYQVFGPSLTSPQSLTFPPSGDEAVYYGYLQEGCNTLTLHLLDTECNETTVDLVNVGRDNTAPAPVVTYSQSDCYNNMPLDAQYGATLLDTDLDIDLAAATGCEAGTFDLTLTILAQNVAAYTAVTSITNYPSAGEALTLWNAIVTAVGANYSGSVTVNWTATDCAGNAANGSFNIPCVDFDAPDNSFTYFDARPTHLGVWLDWSWNASLEAQEMAIYRSPLSAEYPAYPNDLWNTIGNYDVTTYPPAGWTLVATETQLTPGTYLSGTYATTNNRGDFAQHTGYWLDAELGWTDGDGNASAYRDIYRYVTFVKDQGGNWSVGAPVMMLQNADRSTNYWLGDFSTADGAGLPGSRGRVDSDDLALLSVVYFAAVPGDYRNIGPVVVENGNIGKGIPNPDGSGVVNFSDLVPFSFNYGLVSPVGLGNEFVVEPDESVYRPVSRLDGTPDVSLVVPEIATFEVGTEFTVSVTLSGNDAGVVKAVEALLNYDETMFEVVSSTVGTAASSEGTVFAKVNGTSEAGQIGMVAASCGGYSTLDDNATLGTVTFRVTTELTSTCTLELTNVQLFDNTGEIIDIEGETYPLFSAPSVPDNYALYQNYPNPFNPTTNIAFDLKEAGHVKIMVYNTLGQLVALAADNDLTAGRHTVSFDASTLASGVYVYSINVNGFSDLKKMVLIK